MKVLVTGAAGFIGHATSQALLARGDEVIGLDNINDYYDLRLKNARLELLEKQSGFTFIKGDLANRDSLDELFKIHKPERVINLAAQAGVRYSIQNPHAYADSNLTGFLNVLEGCRHHDVEHLVFASSSSVYGANTKMPFAEEDEVNHPVSLYAASKKANELMAHSYAHLYKLPVHRPEVLYRVRPMGRPDMSPFIFTRKIMNGDPIDVFNFGNHERDFTYIDDIVAGVLATLDQVAQPDEQWSSDTPNPDSSSAPYRIFNIGNNEPVKLMYFIECIEKAVGKEATKNMLPMQPGDVLATYASIDKLNAATGFKPTTSIEEGVDRFVEWYKRFYN